MVAGNLACYMTAAVAGLLYDPERELLSMNEPFKFTLHGHFYNDVSMVEGWANMMK